MVQRSVVIFEAEIDEFRNEVVCSVSAIMKMLIRFLCKNEVIKVGLRSSIFFFSFGEYNPHNSPIMLCLLYRNVSYVTSLDWSLSPIKVLEEEKK